MKFVGVGENVEDLDMFHPDRVASRILGMMSFLLLKSTGENGLEAAEKSAERMMRGEFTLKICWFS